MHAYQMGPAQDLNRTRIGRHGSLRVEGRTLLFVADDGGQVSFSLDEWTDVAELAAELLGKIPIRGHGVSLLPAWRTVREWVQAEKAAGE